MRHRKLMSLLLAASLLGCHAGAGMKNALAFSGFSGEKELAAEKEEELSEKNKMDIPGESGDFEEVSDAREIPWEENSSGTSCGSDTLPPGLSREEELSGEEEISEEEEISKEEEIFEEEEVSKGEISEKELSGEEFFEEELSGEEFFEEELSGERFSEEGLSGEELSGEAFFGGEAFAEENLTAEEVSDGDSPELLLRQGEETARADQDTVLAVYEATGKFLADCAREYTPQVSSVNGEWQILGLARSGQEVDPALYSRYMSNVVRTLTERGGILHSRKYTEYSRVVLALTAIGEDVEDVGGYDLLQPLADFDQTVWQGINGAIFALLAFDCHGYEIPAALEGQTQTTRERLIDHILGLELSGGGWSLSGAAADADITAMALQALAPYCSGNKKVKNAVNRGLKRLSSMQSSDGGFSSWNTANSEGCSQVLVALTALGIDPLTDERFLKSGGTVVDALLSFAVDGGSFRHQKDGAADQMATEQAYYALTAYVRFLRGQNSLYDMTDVWISSDQEKIDSVKSQIQDLPRNVTLQDKDAVRAAMAAYSALNEEQKARVGTELTDRLKNALSALDALEIQNVADLISSIGKVTLEKEGEISRINAAYYLLTEEQRKKVPNYDVLARAMDALYELRHPPTPTPTPAPSPSPGTGSLDRPAQGSTKTLGTVGKTLSSSSGAGAVSAAEAKAEEEDGILPEETEEVKRLLEEIRALFHPEDPKEALPFQAEEYSDAQISALLRIFRSFGELTPAEMLTVKQDESYMEYEGALKKLGAYHHLDQASGVNLQENDEEVLPWYVQMAANPILLSLEQTDIVRQILGEESEVFSLNDIHFVNLLDGGDWHPSEIVRVRIPMVDLGEYENAVVLHIRDDGTMEFLKGNVSGSYLEFDAADFSIYGIAGLNGSVEELLNPPGQKTLIWPWIAVGSGAGILVMILWICRAVGTHRRKKKERAKAIWEMEI